MSTSSGLGMERRKTSRLRIDALIYICFESDDNGGVVLDISEGGLRLRLLAPIETGDVSRLWFLVHGRRVEVEALVAWVDESQRTAGLRFKILSPNSRGEIRAWICALTTSAPSPLTTRSNRAGRTKMVDHVIQFWNMLVKRTRMNAS